MHLYYIGAFVHYYLAGGDWVCPICGVGKDEFEEYKG
jgi:rubrerythrin